MKAILKNGKIIEGNAAEVLTRIGVAQKIVETVADVHASATVTQPDSNDDAIAEAPKQVEAIVEEQAAEPVTEATEEQSDEPSERPTALVVKSLIEQVKTVEELESLVEGDERQVVRNAYKKKLKELTDE